MRSVGRVISPRLKDAPDREISACAASAKNRIAESGRIENRTAVLPIEWGKHANGPLLQGKGFQRPFVKFLDRFRNSAPPSAPHLHKFRYGAVLHDHRTR
jgi:hypothetical protein